MKKLLLIFAAALVTLLPVSSFAEYVIRLHSGRQFLTDRYWEEEEEIRFNYANGTLGFAKDLIASIEEKTQAAPGEAQDGEPAAAKHEPAQRPKQKAAAEKKDKKAAGTALQDLIDKKRALQKQLDAALARLREASKNRDEEAKQKARQEMREYSKEIYAVTEEAKALNNGQLPEGWWQE